MKSKEGTIDPKTWRRGLRRLAHAVWLDVRGMVPGRYQVTGGAEPHIVQKELDGWSCDCDDSVFGGGWCKHAMAVRLVHGDRNVVRALRLLIVNPEPGARRQGNCRRNSTD